MNMKLTIKNLKQVPYEIEVPNDTITVKDLKIAFEQKHGFDASSLKLLYSGAVLDDTKTLNSYNIKTNCVLIMMNAKTKPINIPQNEPPKEQQQQNPPQTISQPQQQQNTNTNDQAQTTTTQKQQKPKHDYTNEIKQLTDMGFGKEEAENAIKAARGQVEIAVEFLYNGIPDYLPMNDDDEDNDNGDDDGNNVNANLKAMASFVKVTCSQDPSALGSIMQEIAENDPDTFKLIQDNEEEFKRLILEPITNRDLQVFQEIQQQMHGGDIEMEDEYQPNEEYPQQQHQHGGHHHQPGTIELTKEEFEAVQRLKVLGNFTEDEAVQAYLACDKNEEHAANLLFESKYNDNHFQIKIIDNNNNNNNSQDQQKKDN